MDLLTQEERARLEKLLEELRAKRKIISERIGAARDLGDLRENAEYHAAREDQGLNEAKIRQLEGRLAAARTADSDVNLPDDMVFLGAVVKLREVERGQEDLYRLVGEATGDFSLDYIEVTVNSPMGTSLLKARIGEVIKVDLPKGTKRFEILEIIVEG